MMNLDEIEVVGSPDVGYQMHQWHGSMWDPVYGVGSCFVAHAPTTAEQVQLAIDGMEENLIRVQQNPSQYDSTDEVDGQSPDDVETEATEILEHLRGRLWVSVAKAMEVQS